MGYKEEEKMNLIQKVNTSISRAFITMFILIPMVILSSTLIIYGKESLSFFVLLGALVLSFLVLFFLFKASRNLIKIWNEIEEVEE